jgi:CRP/FNR family transcriptional regulator, cyclic AMP receptor protein
LIIHETPQTLLFKQEMLYSLQQDPFNTRALVIAKHDHVYNSGDQEERIYCIESGRIKLSMISIDGKECILTILSTGDIFGELCLSGISARMETATAMEATHLKQIARVDFMARLVGERLFEGFVMYMTMRIGAQQQLIADLVTVDSEHRLGKMLLQLAQKLGNKDPRSGRIEQKISHEELSEMVGTTRPRVSMFMRRFKNLGLIETNADHLISIKEQQLAEYISQIG